METSLNHRPYAFLIEDDDRTIAVMREILEEAGFTVIVIKTLMQAAQQLAHHLRRSRSVVPTLVVIDQQLSVTDQPAVEGWALAFFLRAGEQNGTLHPCWIAAVSGQLKARGRADRSEEAQCEYIIDKAYFIDEVATIHQQITSQAIPRHHLSEDLLALHQPAIALLAYFSQEQVAHRPTLWTKRDIYLLLGYRAKAIYLKTARPEAEQLVQQLGGESQALQVIWDGMACLNMQQQDLLRRLLRGEEKVEIYTETTYTRGTIDAAIEEISATIADFHNAKKTTTSNRKAVMPGGGREN